MMNIAKISLFTAISMLIASPLYAVTAVGTETVLGKYFGVNLHMDNCCKGNYGDTDKVIGELQYIGARRARDWASGGTIVGKWHDINAKTGIKFHVSIPQTSPEKQRIALGYISTWLKRYPGLIDAIEGSNEPDTEYPKSQGASLEDAVELQSEVYKVGQDASVPVVQLSVGGNWHPPLWEGNYKNFGKPPADFGNAHVYMTRGAPPGPTLKRIGELAAYSVNGKPVDTTEFGTYQKNQDDQTASAFIHLAPFDSYLLGDTGLFVYALHDDISGVVGFYKEDGTKRDIADYWHNTTALLSDPKGKDLPAKSLDISFTNQQAQGKGSLGIKNVVMYKSDGTVWLAVYDEEKEGASDASQTIVLNKNYAYARQFDARTGKLLYKYNDLNKLDITIPPNHLYIIEFVPRK